MHPRTARLPVCARSLRVAGSGPSRAHDAVPGSVGGAAGRPLRRRQRTGFLHDRACCDRRTARSPVVTIDRPEVRNAVDGPTADGAGAAIATPRPTTTRRRRDRAHRGGRDVLRRRRPARRRRPGAPQPLDRDDAGPMGPTRRPPRKPTIAADRGPRGGRWAGTGAVVRPAGRGRVDAVLGVFCRRWGVPLIDGGTVRLPRVVGLGRALDLILTGRPVDADEALASAWSPRRAPRAAPWRPRSRSATSWRRCPQTTLLADLAVGPGGLRPAPPRGAAGRARRRGGGHRGRRHGRASPGSGRAPDGTARARTRRRAALACGLAPPRLPACGRSRHSRPLTGHDPEHARAVRENLTRDEAAARADRDQSTCARASTST